MFSLLRRSTRPRKPAVPQHGRPFLERLEDRISPAIFPGGGPPPPPPPGPETVSVNVTYDPNRQVTLTGQLSGQSGPLAYQGINLGGVVNGSTLTDSQGNYTITLGVSQLGQVTAASADGQSNTATATLVNGAPVISSFTATFEGGGMWEIAGSVSGAPTQGESVSFGGIPALNGASANVNPDGSFTLFIMVNNGNGGIATAQAVDWWGDISPVATTSVPD